MRLAGLGGHILTIKAEDERGNIAAKEISFSVIATIDSVIDNVSAYETFGYIYSKEVKFLETKLEAIKRLIDRIAGKENKENIINNYKKQVNRQINWLIEYIKEKSDKKNKGLISEIAKNLIIESLEFIKYK